MNRTVLKTGTCAVLGGALAGLASPAAAQVLPGGGQLVAPVQSPAAAAIAAATEVREATVREIYGVDNSSSCDMLLPPGDATPVLYRRASAALSARMQVFGGDTGLVLSGRNLALLQSATLAIPGAAAVRGTIVRRRAATTQCGETVGSDAGIVVLRFAIPAVTALTNATLVMRTRRIYPPSAARFRPCDPEAIGAALEGGIEKFAHCFPDQEFDVPAVPVAIMPRPRILGLTAGTQTNGATSQRVSTTGQIQVGITLTGSNLAQLTAMRREDLPGSAPGASLANFALGITAPRAVLTWFGAVAGQVARGKVLGSVAVLRFPRGSGAGLASARRDLIDTAWAGAAGDPLRSMGEGIFTITALAAPAQPVPVTIKAFDPGNRLFIASGGTTTVANTGVSATMVGLASEAWCSTVPQPAAGAGGVRVVATGLATLPAISWGIRNEGTTQFNGSITAELRMRGRVVDTLTFTGAIPATGTQTKLFNRPTTQVTVGRESLGPVCYYVGEPADAVLENSAYEVKVITPAPNTKALVSLP